MCFGAGEEPASIGSAPPGQGEALQAGSPCSHRVYRQAVAQSPSLFLQSPIFKSCKDFQKGSVAEMLGTSAARGCESVP